MKPDVDKHVLPTLWNGNTHFFIMSDPTMTRALPVAHDGMEAKIGAKKTETKNIRPVTMAVMPVFPPSGVSSISLMGEKDRRRHVKRYAPDIPVADSMKAVTGEVPNREPMVIVIASTQYANVDPSKSCVTGSRRPANFAMEYMVLFERSVLCSRCTSEEIVYPVVSRMAECQKSVWNASERDLPRMST